MYRNKQDFLNQYALPINAPALIFEANTVVQDMIAAVTNGSGLKDAVASFVHFRETMLSSRRALDETPILNLLNTTWDAQMTSSACDSACDMASADTPPTTMALARAKNSRRSMRP